MHTVGERMPLPGELLPQLALIEAMIPDGEGDLSTLEWDVDPREIDGLAADHAGLESLNDTYLDASAHREDIWMSTGRIIRTALSVTYFHPPQSTDELLAGKPSGAGLFTSVGLNGMPSAWLLYLLANEAIFVSPWFASGLTCSPGTRRLLIDSASDWCRFVASHGRRSVGGLLVPDWAMAAESFDAVTLSPKAVASIDGFQFVWGEQRVAASTWSVESTIWLRWMFDSVESIELSLSGGR
jgi:hypothetical protein